MNRQYYTRERSLKSRATVNGHLAGDWMRDTGKYSLPLWDTLQAEIAACYARRAGHAALELERMKETV